MVQMRYCTNIHDQVSNGCAKKISRDVKVGMVLEYHKTHKTSQLPRVNFTTEDACPNLMKEKLGVD